MYYTRYENLRKKEDSLIQRDESRIEIFRIQIFLVVTQHFYVTLVYQWRPIVIIFTR